MGHPARLEECFALLQERRMGAGMLNRNKVVPLNQGDPHHTDGWKLEHETQFTPAAHVVAAESARLPHVTADVPP